MYSDNQYQVALDNTAAMLDSVEDYMKTRYTIEQNKEMREREDNATQRRVDDLKKAGLSPTLAAGSPASSAQGAQPSGSVVGAYLSTKNAIEQLRQNRVYTEQMRLATEEMRRQNNMSKMAYMYSLGFEPTDYIYNNSGDVDTVMYEPAEEHGTYWRGADFGNSPFMKMLRGNTQMFNNELEVSNLNREMTGKENTWYNFNQGLNAVSTGVGVGLNAFNTFGSYGLKNKALNQDFQQFQSELNRKQNYDNWRMSPHGESYVNNRGFRYTRSMY